ncbi:MAG: histidine kinase [Nibricoccus sp.]
MAKSPKPEFSYYLFSQLLGWGVFLVLRLIITYVYCAKRPEINLAAALAWEVADHLAQAFSSHLIWKWMHWRGLFDKGLKRMLSEGYAAALFMSALVVLLVWWPCRQTYHQDFTRVGETTMAMFVGMQHALVTVLWFSAILAIHYFNRTRALELQHAESAAVAREAQLHALKGQINPHFLFNSFNSLRALIDENPALARDAVTHLAVIMRYSLTSLERKLVPLSEELRVVALYLELEKLRLGNRLAVVSQIDPGLESNYLPPLLLQGLVENAVKFGPAARKQGGEIVYSAQAMDAHLYLRVTNPGRLGTSSESTGTGLKNIRDRLRLLYGETARFSLSEEAGERVIAEVVLPLSTTTLHGTK